MTFLYLNVVLMHGRPRGQQLLFLPHILLRYFSGTKGHIGRISVPSLIYLHVCKFYISSKILTGGLVGSSFTFREFFAVGHFETSIFELLVCVCVYVCVCTCVCVCVCTRVFRYVSVYIDAHDRGSLMTPPISSSRSLSLGLSFYFSNSLSLALALAHSLALSHSASRSVCEQGLTQSRNPWPSCRQRPPRAKSPHVLLQNGCGPQGCGGNPKGGHTLIKPKKKMKKKSEEYTAVTHSTAKRLSHPKFIKKKKRELYRSHAPHGQAGISLGLLPPGPLEHLTLSPQHTTKYNN